MIRIERQRGNFRSVLSLIVSKLTQSAYALSLIVPLAAGAVVDMKEANYNEIWTDLLIQGTNQLRVQRYYNSRSNFNGMFGYGWCSDFETNIEKTPEGGLRALECGDGKLTFYKPEKFDQKQVDKSVDDILTAFKKKNSGTNAETLKLYRERLINDADHRAEAAKQYEVPIPEAVKGVTYRAENLEVERIVFDGTSYTRTLTDGVIQKFDRRGRLTALYDKSMNFLKLTWADTGLKTVQDNRGRQLSLVVQNKRVRKITGPNNTNVDYQYKGEDLVGVTNMWGNAYTFNYDEGHNLIKVVYPTGTIKKMTYDQKNDWITSYTEDFGKPNPCTEKYQYNGVDGDRKHYWSEATKTCGKEVKNKARFDFWYEKAPDGRSILARVATKSMTESVDISYDNKLGKPKVIKRNGVTTTFDYFPTGLLRRKDTATTKMVFAYNTVNNKVSKVMTEYVDPNSKKVERSRETNFEYDKRGNLVRAANSDGQNIKLSYDERGRIATMLDQAKKEVLIKYDEKTGKPFRITRPKLGTITISYKPNGEIQKVDSPDGPTVAVQIASTFNNLLDIISPATSELEL